jgi:hypothetical protein
VELSRAEFVGHSKVGMSLITLSRRGRPCSPTGIQATAPSPTSVRNQQRAKGRLLPVPQYYKDENRASFHSTFVQE